MLTEFTRYLAINSIPIGLIVFLFIILKNEDYIKKLTNTVKRLLKIVIICYFISILLNFIMIFVKG